MDTKIGQTVLGHFIPIDALLFPGVAGFAAKRRKRSFSSFYPWPKPEYIGMAQSLLN
jgi:hypothetical protein